MSRIWIILLLTGCAGTTLDERRKAPVAGVPDAAIGVDANGGTPGAGGSAVGGSAVGGSAVGGSAAGGSAAGGCSAASCPTPACPPERRLPPLPGECCERCMPCGVGPCPVQTLCPPGEARMVPDAECCGVCAPIPTGGVCDQEAAPSFIDKESAALNLYSCKEDADCTLRSLGSPCGGGCDTAVNASAVDEYLRRLYAYADTHCVNCGVFSCSVALACPLDGSACYPAVEGMRARCVHGRCETAERCLDGSEYVPGVLDAGTSGQPCGDVRTSHPRTPTDCPLVVPANAAPCALQSGDVCYFGGSTCEGMTTARCLDGYWIVVPGPKIPCGSAPPPPP